MKLALIPPIPDLHRFQPTGYNLILAHLVTEQTYYEHYHARYLAGDFNILDNGAHENHHFDFPELILMAKGLAHEVVIPDVPHNTEATIEKLQSAIRWLDNLDDPVWSIYRGSESPRLMIVPQVPLGPGYALDYAETAARMIEICEKSRLPNSKFTVGVALMYDDGGQEFFRIIERLEILTDNSGMDVHLLGWSRHGATPMQIAADFPWIRGIDTAKPFVYGRERIYLDEAPSTWPRYPGRPEDYFTKKLTPEEAHIGNYNSNVLQSLLFESNLSGVRQYQSDLYEEDWDEAGSDSVGLSDSARVQEGDTP